MNKVFRGLVVVFGICALMAQAQAKKKTETNGSAADQQQSGPAEPAAPPSYQPFPHYRNFVLTEINGKPSRGAPKPLAYQFIIIIGVGRRLTLKSSLRRLIGSLSIKCSHVLISFRFTAPTHPRPIICFPQDD